MFICGLFTQRARFASVSKSSDGLLGSTIESNTSESRGEIYVEKR